MVAAAAVTWARAGCGAAAVAWRLLASGCLRAFARLSVAVAVAASLLPLAGLFLTACQGLAAAVARGCRCMQPVGCLLPADPAASGAVPRSFVARSGDGRGWWFGHRFRSSGAGGRPVRATGRLRATEVRGLAAGHPARGERELFRPDPDPRGTSYHIAAVVVSSDDQEALCAPTDAWAISGGIPLGAGVWPSADVRLVARRGRGQAICDAGSSARRSVARAGCQAAARRPERHRRPGGLGCGSGNSGTLVFYLRRPLAADGPLCHRLWKQGSRSS